MATGIIKTLTDRGLGFISIPNLKKDRFFHAKELQGITYDELRVGDRVDFDLVEGSRGPFAANVRHRDRGVSGQSDEGIWEAATLEPEAEAAQIVASEAIEAFRELKPDLIKHLQRHGEDLAKIRPDVFEQLVGELLRSTGWEDIRFVGRNPRTSADIFAGHYTPGGLGQHRMFVEVKRWRKRIGVEVFNQVLGAMISEREDFGWHSALIVALGGASDTRKYDRDQWRRKGLEVKDKEDLMHWLRDYKPNTEGLWVRRQEERTDAPELKTSKTV